MKLTNLTDESLEYVSAREALRLEEINLMRHREQVAELRRQLPVGPVLPDYVLHEGPTDLTAFDGVVRDVRLADLLSEGDRPLIVYHLMYGKRQSTPCPMCTMWIDGFSAIARHVFQNADLAVVAAAEIGLLRAHARDRGWHGVRVLSAGESTFKFDLGSEDEEGNQDARVSVFTKDDVGNVLHRYTAAPRLADDIDQRGIDLLCSTWHLLDLTPQGRGEWYASTDY